MIPLAIPEDLGCASTGLAICVLRLLCLKAFIACGAQFLSIWKLAKGSLLTGATLNPAERLLLVFSNSPGDVDIRFLC